MFKRIGVLVMMLAGSMAVFTPAVAQAHDYYGSRYDRRECRRDWREHERRDRRDYRPYGYYGR